MMGRMNLFSFGLMAMISRRYSFNKSDRIDIIEINSLQIDVLMGCSRGLMSLIHRISVLASTRAKVDQYKNPRDRK